MRRSTTALPLLVLLAALLAQPVVASDKAKEQRWAEQIVDQLIEGESLWLQAGDDRFLAILTEAEGKPRGAVILLHGIGVHPNWPQVIYPLRVGLASRGWTTLSLQLPILANDASSEEYRPLNPEVAPRIDAGLHFLVDRDLGPISIVAHSQGATRAANYLRDARPGGSIVALVGIGMSGIPGDDYADIAASLPRIGLPVLDLYGEHDLDAVVERAERRFAAGSGNPRYRQQRVAGANHFFDGQEEALVEAVASWLGENANP
jgi:pimeloyl-ACP methyl ester carboxylesterase